MYQKPTHTHPGAEALTDMERSVLTCLIREESPSDKVIASRLGIAEGTVRAHLLNASKRLGIKKRVPLAVWAATNLPVSA